MFSILTSWMKPKTTRRTAQRIKPKSTRATLGLMTMEAREVPAVLHSDLVNAFNAGANVARDVSNAAQVVSVFGSDIPVIKENIAPVANLADQFSKAFAKLDEATAIVSPTAVIAGVDAEFQKVAKQIQDTVPGTVVTRFSLTPDANGDLVHINYKATKQINLPSFSAGGDTNGFAFFDGAVNGKIEGSLTSSKTANVGLDVVYGVDLVNGVPTFYVAEGSKLGLEKFNITGDTKGTLAIRSLANVTVSGKLDANLQGNVTLVDTKDGVQDHRVRVSALAASAKGDLTGTSVTLGTTASPIKFEARVPVLGSITWTGQFAGGFNGTSFKVDGANTKLNAPDPLMVLKQAVKGVLGSFAGDNLSLLSGDFKGTLGKKLEDLRNIDILSELGLSSDKFAFSNNSSQIDSKSTLQAIKDALPPEFKLLPGKDLTMENLKTAVDKLINGEYVDLVSYTLTKEFTPLQASQALPAVTFPILPFLQGKFNLSLEEKAGVKVFVGVGFDTTGLYIDPRTSLSLNGSIQLSAEAAVTLFGLAGVSLDVNGGVGLDAGIKINDPDPSDGKVYLDELIDLASNATSVASGITNSMSFFAKANLTGGVRAELDLPFPLPDVTLLEKKFTLSSLFSTASDKTVQSTTGKATFRTVPLFPNSKLDVDALINSAGVLTINAASDPTGGNVQLSQVDGKVKVVWSSQGAGTATKAVNKVIFLGSALADRLETSESFNIPIDAKGFDGNDQLTGGLMADVLDGGNGADILIGNGGSDTLKAGTGFNTVRGGDGDDLITAGNDGNAIFGNDGNDNISSGDGADEIEGGQGNDIINAGNGNNVVFGGDGADRITAGTGKDILDGGLGNDIIDAGDGADLLIGGDGADTLRGQAGNDRLLGDAGADRLEGGAGDDILRGGADNDFLIGNAGDDIISGGTGQDTEFGDDEAMNGLEIGRDSFEIDFKDADSLKDILRGGPERDVITISGAVNEVTNVELADDILIAPGSVPGEFSVGRRDVGATGPRQTVFFQIPTDIDGVVIRGGGGDDRIEVTESLTAPISVDGGLGNDIILGGGGNDKLYGNAGNDTIDGRGGNDEIYGDGDNGIVTNPIVKVESGEGNDTLFGGAGVDLIYGNGGTDRIDGGLLQDFIHGGKGSDIILNTGDNHGDQIFGEEDADVIVGGIGRDIIKGGSGNDTILGGAGGDIIDGEEGDDTIVGETGRDVINGGAGDDNLKAFLDNDLRASLNTVYKLTLQALTMPTTDAEAVTLTPPLQAQMAAVLKQKLQLQSQSTVGLTQEQIDARNAELTRLEDLVKDIASQIDDLLFYASQGNDTLNGDAGKDTLTGSPFNDILNGGADDDTLIQSDLSRFGGDIFNGDAGNDVFVMFGTPLADAITFKQGRDKNGVLIDGAIDVFGNGGAPIGSFGNGTKAAFLGIENIRVNLGDGDDTADFSGLGLKVPLPAGGTIQVDGGNGNDIINAAGYNGPTMLLGGNGNDTITGGLVNDVIQGGNDNDRIDSGTGDDTIYGDLIDGGIGNDTIFGGAGKDLIFAGAGDDTVEADPSLGNPGSGNDTVFGGDGNDTITAGFGSDYVDGGAGDDRIYGDTSLTAAGTATDPDNDTLVGGLGADTLFGSGGADFLVGNTTTGVSDGSIDFLDGGIGNDTAQVSYIGVKEQFVGIEKLDVVKPATTNILVRNDFTIVAVEANGNVYVGGVLSSDHAINVQFSPDRKVIYIQSSSNSLIGFTASGKRTVMMTGIDFFEVQTDGRIKVTFPEVINPKTREGKVPTQILLGLTQ